ncbi:MAG: hypothetical protein U5K54_02330 [Cytophagales bacterium]|nr:hypothetical protein [Cytophagales bacterium]
MIKFILQKIQWPGLLMLLALGCHAQTIDPAVFSKMEYRFIGPEGNRAIAIAGEPGNPMVNLYRSCFRWVV